MNVFNKIIFPSQKTDQRLEHDDSVLVMPRKAVNRLVAIAILCAFFIFISGYFLGKRKGVEAFTNAVTKESFSDQINFSLSTLYDRYQTKDGETVEIAPGKADLQKVTEESSVEEQSATISTIKNSVVLEKPDIIEKVLEKPTPFTKYQAQLVGGPAAMIQQFVARLARRGITVYSRKRVSKTARGKTMNWYQAVTPQMSSKQEIENLLERIKKTEKLEGVRIIEVNS